MGHDSRDLGKRTSISPIQPGYSCSDVRSSSPLPMHSLTNASSRAVSEMHLAGFHSPSSIKLPTTKMFSPNAVYRMNVYDRAYADEAADCTNLRDDTELYEHVVCSAHGVAAERVILF